MHNTRIERLWYDVTHGFGQKWKNLFLELETHHDLQPTNPAHIWLLHHLFLAAINQDALEWAGTWNSHPMTLPRGQGTRSPREIFFFSMLQDGLRGRLPEVAHEHVEDPANYGIDWADATEPRLMNHLLENNPQDWEDDNPFASGSTRLSHVPCKAPNYPISAEQVHEMDTQLRARLPFQSSNMLDRRNLWVTALEIAAELVAKAL